MKQIIKDNYGLILVSIDTTIHDLESFLEDLKDSEIEDSPEKSITNTIESYRNLLSALKSDTISDYNEKQILAILEHRKRVLETQKKKIDETIPPIENLISNISKMDSNI